MFKPLLFMLEFVQKILLIFFNGKKSLLLTNIFGFGRSVRTVQK